MHKKSCIVWIWLLIYDSFKWLEQCLEYELNTKISQEKLFCSWLFAYAKSWAAIPEKNIYFCIFVHRYLAARGYRGIIVSIDGWGLNGYCFRFLPFATLFCLLSIDLIYWPGLTRHQSLRCYQKTIFLVDVLKVTRYDWQKSHFSPVVCSQWGRTHRGRWSEVCSCSKKNFMNFKYLTSFAGEKCLGWAYV